MIRINSGSKIGGSIKVSGSKNSALPIICASLISKKRVVLYNVPRITDVFILLNIIKTLNVAYTFKKNKLIIDSKDIIYKSLAIDLVGKLRGSSYLMSVMLYLFKQVHISRPGGCNLGKRGFDLHYFAFEQLGAVVLDTGIIDIKMANKKPNDICFERISVGATINAIILSLGVKRAIKIYNYSKEPEVIHLISFLKKLGHKIYQMNDYLLVLGGLIIKNNVKYKIPYDRIEAQSYILLGLASNGIRVKKCPINEMKEFFLTLKKMKVSYKILFDSVYIKSQIFNGVDVTASVYPGFPTDTLPVLVAILTKANGVSKINDNIYKDRFNYVKSLELLNANIYKKDNNVYIMPSVLTGGIVKGYDLRGVFSVILALIISKEGGIVLDSDIAKRGYENLVDKLRGINVNVVEIN